MSNASRRLQCETVETAGNRVPSQPFFGWVWRVVAIITLLGTRYTGGSGDTCVPPAHLSKCGGDCGQVEVTGATGLHAHKRKIVVLRQCRALAACLVRCGEWVAMARATAPDVHSTLAFGNKPTVRADSPLPPQIFAWKFEDGRVPGAGVDTEILGQTPYQTTLDGRARVRRRA
eukprot:6916476-Prymnesium_polylepis.1